MIPQTMEAALENKMNEIAKQFAANVKVTGCSYTKAWEDVKSNCCFGPKILEKLSQKCVVTANEILGTFSRI